MMKKAAITIMMLAAVCMAQGPAQAREASRTNDGNYVYTYDCSQFSKISIGDVVAVSGANRHINFRTMGDLTVKLVRSDECRVELSVNYEEYADLFHANLEDGVLYIKVSASNESLKPRPEATVTVFTPSFEELYIHGVSKVRSEGTFGGKTVSVKIGGVSTLSGLSVEADTADFNFGGTCNVSGLSVVAKSADIDASGTCDMNDLTIVAKDRLSLASYGCMKMKGLRLESDNLEINAKNVIDIYGATLIGGDLKMICPSSVFTLKDASASCDSASFELRGTNNIEFNSLTAGTINEMLLSGSNTFKASGTADSIDLSMSYTGTADLKDLKCRKVTVDLHNVCSASVYASEYLNYNVADRTCYLDYYGNPENVTGKGPEIITKH